MKWRGRYARFYRKNQLVAGLLVVNVMTSLIHVPIGRIVIRFRTKLQNIIYDIIV